MPSEKVLKGLEELHQQLNKMQPAIYHVEMAQELTKQVKRLPEHHLDFMEKMKSQDKKHKSDLSEEFKTYAKLIGEEIERLTKKADDSFQRTKEQQEQIVNLKLTVEKLINQLVSMNVPETLQNIQQQQVNRFEALSKKSDEVKAGVNQEIQYVQAEVNSVSTSLTDHLSKLEKQQKNLMIMLAVVALLVVGLGVVLRLG